MGGAVLRLGWTNPLTDSFGAHPQLGAVLDLNDGVTFTLVGQAGAPALELPPPARTLVLAGNIRTQGERATRGVYRRSRRATAQVALGAMASATDLAAAVRLLLAWLDAPPQVPITAQYQAPGASAPVYLDVIGCSHAIPDDEGEWLRLQLEPVEIVLIARPGLRGDRVTLSNLVCNPGFEAPSGPPVFAFADSCANVDAFTVLGGAAPTFGGGVVTIPSGTSVLLGSPAWSAINLWHLRFQWVAGLVAYFYINWADSGDKLLAEIDGTYLTLIHVAGGVANQIAQVACPLTASGWYWLGFTRFPAVPGQAPATQCAVAGDSAGAPGAQVALAGPAACADPVLGLTGQLALFASGAALNLGGAPNSNTVALFGPGAWEFSSTNGNAANGVASGAWEQNGANTFPGGPVSSFGAARIDLPPLGAVDAHWQTYLTGSAPLLGTTVPVAVVGDTLGLSAWVRSAGLGASAVLHLDVAELDATGAVLASATAATLTGNQTSWTQLAATYAAQHVGCVAFDVVLRVVDATAGSARGTVWFDNVQCWDVTQTGQSSMPYCELRFPQAPTMLVLSGLLGDLVAPAQLSLGTYLASWPAASTLGFALGRRGGVSRTAQLAGASNGYYGTVLSPTSVPVLDAASYGGYYVQAQVTSSGWNPRAFSFAPADALGTYHLFGRFLTHQSAGNLANVQVRMEMIQQGSGWFGKLDGSDEYAAYYGPYAAPVLASATWTVLDAGQASVPPFHQGALTDPTQGFLTPRTNWSDLTGGPPAGSLCQMNWQLLLPVDGSLLTGVLNNPANVRVGLATSWLWAYFDGLLVNRAGADDGPAATYSVEARAVANPARGAGGPGTQSTGPININLGADPYLTLDPSQQLAGAASAGGVNQLGVYLADGAAAVLPVVAEVSYSPLYLYPR